MWGHWFPQQLEKAALAMYGMIIQVFWIALEPCHVESRQRCCALPSSCRLWEHCEVVLAKATKCVSWIKLKPGNKNSIHYPVHGVYVFFKRHAVRSCSSIATSNMRISRFQHKGSKRLASEGQATSSSLFPNAVKPSQIVRCSVLVPRSDPRSP